MAVLEASETTQSRRAEPRGSALRFIARDKKALVGLIVLVVLALAGLLAPLIAPYDPNAMEFDMIGSPSWAHPLGTDDLGRDLLSRLIYGTRISLTIGVIAVSIYIFIGIVLGSCAARMALFDYGIC